MRDPARLGLRTLVAAATLIVAALVLVRFWTAHARQSQTLASDRVDPAALPDGRVVYAHALAAADPDGRMALFVAQPDGREERRITFGDAQDRTPALLPDGRIVFRRQVRSEHGPGRLLVINPDGTGLQLFSDAAAGASIEGGPWVVNDRVAFVEDARNGSRPRLVAVSPHQPLGEREIVAETEPRSDLSAAFRLILLALGASQTRAMPLSLTSVVDERKSTGTLLCLDVRTSRLRAAMAALPGAIRVVRVLAADGQLLGEAPVEADGSFFIEVPADQPLHLELRDARGLVAADHSGFWVRPNENRGCVGCHEDPELSPENRVVLALARGATPVGTTALVMQSEARVP